MTKYVTFKEDDLNQVLSHIEYRLNEIDFWLKMAKEQSKGTRDNITMEDMGKLLEDTERIRIELKAFQL